MTVQKLQKDLQELLDEGKTQLNSEVYFRHTIRDHNSKYSSVDYILYGEKPGALVLNYDDGHF